MVLPLVGPVFSEIDTTRVEGRLESGPFSSRFGVLVVRILLVVVVVVVEVIRLPSLPYSILVFIGDWAY